MRKIFKLLFALVLLLLIYGYGESLYHIFHVLNWYERTQRYFIIVLPISLLLFTFIIRGYSYISIFKHELTHNIFCLLTFQKPVGFHVLEGGGGLFNYAGRGNFLISLSPYFSYTTTLLLLPIYLLNIGSTNVYFIMLAIAAGFDLTTILKDIHPNQSDIKEYGYIFSFIFIIFGNIFSLGLLLSFVQERWVGMYAFMLSGIENFILLVSKFESFCGYFLH